MIPLYAFVVLFAPMALAAIWKARTTEVEL